MVRKPKRKYRSDRNYQDWMVVKDSIQYKRITRSFKEWEIWWCAVGENVGVEINGKGDRFLRPVIVFKKFSKLSFTGIPTTTQNHTKRSPDWYVHFRLKGVDEYAAINQIETISSYRLYRKIGELDDEDIRRIRTGLYNLYKIKMPPRKRGVGGIIPKNGLIVTKIKRIVKRLNG